MKAILSVTHKCNLACKYCYAGRTNMRDMSLDTARKIIDFTFANVPTGQPIEFSFFGGEPLIRFDLIQESVAYIRQKQQQDDRQIRLSITTNGTILTPEMLDFFNREDVDLCISIDGVAHVHDRYRVYRDGRGSFADVQRNLRIAQHSLNALQVNAVYSPDTLDDLPETVAFLIDMGLPVIHINPNISAVWDEQTYRRIPQVFMTLANLYIDSYKAGKEIAINVIDSKLVLLLKGGYSIQDVCGVGNTEWAFAPSGNLYLCERFIGEDNDPTFCMGNIHTSIDLSQRCRVARPHENRTAECKTCELKKFCMNWCRCTNFFMTGNESLVGGALCVMEQSAIRCAEHVMLALAELDNETFIDHLLHYASTAQDCQS